MHKSFERLFGEAVEGPEPGTPKSGIGHYGILLYVRPTIEWTGLNFYQVMEMPIIQFFNLYCFNLDWNHFREQEMKKMMKKR